MFSFFKDFKKQISLLTLSRESLSFILSFSSILMATFLMHNCTFSFVFKWIPKCTFPNVPSPIAFWIEQLPIILPSAEYKCIITRFGLCLNFTHLKINILIITERKFLYNWCYLIEIDISYQIPLKRVVFLLLFLSFLESKGNTCEIHNDEGRNHRRLHLDYLYNFSDFAYLNSFYFHLNPH